MEIRSKSRRWIWVLFLILTLVVMAFLSAKSSSVQAKGLLQVTYPPTEEPTVLPLDGQDGTPEATVPPQNPPSTESTPVPVFTPVPKEQLKVAKLTHGVIKPPDSVCPNSAYFIIDKFGDTGQYSENNAAGYPRIKFLGKNGCVQIHLVNAIIDTAAAMANTDVGWRRVSILYPQNMSKTPTDEESAKIEYVWEVYGDGASINGDEISLKVIPVVKRFPFAVLGPLFRQAPSLMTCPATAYHLRFTNQWQFNKDDGSGSGPLAPGLYWRWTPGRFTGWEWVDGTDENTSCVTLKTNGYITSAAAMTEYKLPLQTTVLGDTIVVSTLNGSPLRSPFWISVMGEAGPRIMGIIQGTPDQNSSSGSPDGQG